MAADKVWAQYTDDAGNNYSVFVAKWWFDKVFTGFTDTPFRAYDNDPILPRNLKVRYITFTDATDGKHRRMVCGNVDTRFWTQVPAEYTATLDGLGNTSRTYTATGRVGEKLRRGPHS